MASATLVGAFVASGAAYFACSNPRRSVTGGVNGEGEGTAGERAGAALVGSGRVMGDDDVGEPMETPTPLVPPNRPPSSRLEALRCISHSMRWGIAESLGKWDIRDLVIGLAYLSRRRSWEPDAVLAASGAPLVKLTGTGSACDLANISDLPRDLMLRVRRMLAFCAALRDSQRRDPHSNRANWTDTLGLPSEACVVRSEVRAGMLRPAYTLFRDETYKRFVLTIRGTHTMKDTMTCLMGQTLPHHVLVRDTDGSARLVMGYAHAGMLTSARFILAQMLEELEARMEAEPDMELCLVGHSLGGATAALLTMLLRERGGPCGKATCFTFACPACVTEELARACAPYVFSLINATDVIPVFSQANMDSLREEVLQSSWYDSLVNDVHRIRVLRAVKSLGPLAWAGGTVARAAGYGAMTSMQYGWSAGRGAVKAAKEVGYWVGGGIKHCVSTRLTPENTSVSDAKPGSPEAAAAANAAAGTLSERLAGAPDEGAGLVLDDVLELDRLDEADEEVAAAADATGEGVASSSTLSRARPSAPADGAPAPSSSASAAAPPALANARRRAARATAAAPAPSDGGPPPASNVAAEGRPVGALFPAGALFHMAKSPQGGGHRMYGPVPFSVYTTMRLCQDMVADHMLWNYSSSLEGVLAGLNLWPSDEEKAPMPRRL